MDLEEAASVTLQQPLYKNPVPFFCGMVTIPKEIFCIIWTSTSVSIAQNHHLY